jgi:hypothetical protein
MILTSLKGMLKGYSFFGVISIIFLTHISYGIGFIFGFLKKELKR